jgi:exodeoxyribonuclease VII small subunit
MSPSPSSEHDAKDAPSFESMLDDLDRTVHALESGDLDLADALRHYEHGVHLIARCRTLLDQAEQHVALLTGLDSEGNPITAPFTADSVAEAEKPVRTTPRRP